ncbi:hypothetical protein [Peribacillus muralis]|uniref:hypothetical protein n=1 Tax=Peribacillus muralis TaxID=264697 RepID=UPI003D05BE1F
MLYFVAYVVIGLVLAAIPLKWIVKEILKKSKHDNEDSTVLVLSVLMAMFLVPIIFVPLWPMILTLKFLGLFKKK